MPTVAITTDLPRPVEDVFAFFRQPANLVQLAPPELNLELLAAPAELALGARLTWKGRRMGISQQLVNEVTAFEENVLMVQEQRQGPFRRWVVTQHFERIADGTRLRETIEFEPPGGMLGLL